jgi:predicted enzyme related to lactoylglutathione lyase
MDKVVHFEIPADNLDRAKTFYKDIFGWEMMDVPGYPEPYAIVRTVAVDERNMPKEAGAINGGITMRSKKGETPVLVIDVPSVDAYLKKIAKRGGRVVQPKQNVMDMGLYARVTDTEGNVIGIWEDIRK